MAPAAPRSTRPVSWRRRWTSRALLRRDSRHNDEVCKVGRRGLQGCDRIDATSRYSCCGRHRTAGIAGGRWKNLRGDVGIELPFDPGDLVLQQQLALLEATDLQLVKQRLRFEA